MISKLWPFLIVIIFCLYILKSFTFIDPDFGWHLKTGQLILSSGFPKTDPFSYSMPSFPYVDHSWLTDVFFALAFPIVGQLGLAVIFSGLTFLAIIISFRIVGWHRWFGWQYPESSNDEGKLSRREADKATESLEKGIARTQLISIILAATIFFNFVTIRPLVFSWLLFSVLIYILFELKRYKQWRFVLPFIFLLWSNLHGGFVGGLIVLAIFIAGKSWEKKTLLLSDFLIFIISLLITLINPYSTGLWKEVWSIIAEPSLRFKIDEWLPTPLIFSPAMVFFIVTTAFLFWRYRKHYVTPILLIYLFLLIQGLSGIRHIPLLTLISLPVFLTTTNHLYNQAKNLPHGEKRFNQVVKFTLIGVFLLLILQLWLNFKDWDSLAENKIYPKAAVSYLKKNLPKKQLYSIYNWGGYLIWKLPEKKVFIDGRMPGWHQNIPGETNSVFQDYLKLEERKLPFKTLVERYQINTALLPAQKDKENNFLTRLDNQLKELIRITLHQPKFTPLPPIHQQIESLGWEKIYQDDLAVIYQSATIQ